MYFKQFYLGCLAQASYLVGSEGVAAVVDPRRDVEEYLHDAETQGLKIRHVLETHLHADFVSGHRELAERTGAEIVFSEKAGVQFLHRAVKEGDEVRLGKVVLRILETPGHTPESLSILVIDTEVSEEPRLVLTGDTLFIGDVGRPDLVGSRGFSAEVMAGLLYDSLHTKLLALADGVEVYPAHGAGSLCGRNISKETSSTIGAERRTNYALRPMPREQFVRMMTADLPEAPAYFPRDVEINREGAALLGERPLPAALTAQETARLTADGKASVLDVRPYAAYGAAHVPGSVNVGLSGQFASWAATLLDPKVPLVLVTAEDTDVGEAVTRLARVGLEGVAGYLKEGIAAWDRAGIPLAFLQQIAVDELHARIADMGAHLVVLDVRRPGEYASGHVPGAVNIPLDRLDKLVSGLDPARPTAVICAGGYRSSAASSLLERRGFRDLVNVIGGTGAWVAAGYEVEGAVGQA